MYGESSANCQNSMSGGTNRELLGRALALVGGCRKRIDFVQAGAIGTRRCERLSLAFGVCNPVVGPAKLELCSEDIANSYHPLGITLISPQIITLQANSSIPYYRSRLFNLANRLVCSNIFSPSFRRSFCQIWRSFICLFDLGDGR